MERVRIPSHSRRQGGGILEPLVSQGTMLCGYFTVTLDPYPFLGLLGFLIRQLKV